MSYIYEASGELDQAIACEERCVSLLASIEDVNAPHSRANLERLKRQRDSAAGD
jgi:hypothetical protein